jgi:hypothetical protein
MLADQLLYTGSATGPCLYAYLFPERLGHVPATARKGSCGDGSGRTEPGLRAGTVTAGSLLVRYRLRPSGVARMRAALSRLSAR